MQELRRAQDYFYTWPTEEHLIERMCPGLLYVNPPPNTKRESSDESVSSVDSSTSASEEGEKCLPGCDVDGVVTDPVMLEGINEGIRRMEVRSQHKINVIRSKEPKSILKTTTKQEDDNAWAGPAVEFGEDTEMTFETDNMDVDDESNSPTTDSWEKHKLRTDTFRTAGGKAPGRSWKKWLCDQIGLTSWRDKRQNARDAAVALAATRAYDVMDDEHVDVEPMVKTVEYIRQSMDNMLGKRKHNIHHRSANRYNKRVAMVKTLVEELKATAPGKFTKTEADRRALHLCVKQVVKAAWKDGVEMGVDNEKRKIRRQERGYYIRAVCVAYYLGDDDDAFWAALESGVDPPLA